MADPNDHLAVVVQQSPMAADSQIPKNPSCVVCARRKVRCDRNDPCSACIKRGAECVFPTHIPPRRRKRQRSEDRRHSGFPYQSPIRQDNAASARISHLDHPATTRNAFPSGSRAEQGMLLTGDGKSIYLDSNVWTSVRGELPRAEDVLRDISDNDSNHSAQGVDDEVSLILGETVKKSLSALHPSPLHIFKLWQTFLENINPLIKILHGPTVQQQLLEASGSLNTVSKELEALMFSIYCIALVSLKADDVQKTYGESKALLLSRFRRGARLAFTKAGILRTSKTVVLQAFVLYLLSMRASSDPQSIWSLCGVAVRMAQRIGLHRDGSELGLSIFETEIRRRLWRQLSILDVTTAQSSGITSQFPYFSVDVLPPSNINDSELDPRMTDMPRENHGATEMMFVLARSEFGEWMRRWSKAGGASHGGRGFLASSALSYEAKDQAIEELSRAFESKFLSYCDKSIPLHYMSARLMQNVVCQMRFSAHHPRQYGEKDHISLAERDFVFSTCVQVMEGFEDCQSNEIIQRYLWHVDNHIPWDVLIYTLYELRTRIDEEETKRSWVLIDRIYSRHYDQMRNRPKTPLHIAIQGLILKAWKSHSEERTRRNRHLLPRPHIVSVLSERSERGTSSHQPSFEPSVTPQGRTTQETIPSNAGMLDPGDDLNNFDHSPLDWGQWDDLLENFQLEFPNSELFSTDAF
ncbi:fungal specific transcription factor domain protein [Aspergillus nomiae NRRL 13137]|uniref:Fungal specific transcription factor domain protein n=1 Tax=Aspergillus nomiae NRRL (strain ATCC 15546 / NRRL 13137 / CBS 260.88 / M93) TaxID=1509407 RepID=A0A0L1IQM0_ASPN3|nr:fungal specific transcription factor domain protein [Aspergillus nomiae NRRL 13137]KNG81473.1 fungal specific transcription factor domain protein [Aspergillus nomiae NRRL 13137]